MIGRVGQFDQKYCIIHPSIHGQNSFIQYSIVGLVRPFWIQLELRDVLPGFVLRKCTIGRHCPNHISPNPFGCPPGVERVEWIDDELIHLCEFIFNILCIFLPWFCSRCSPLTTISFPCTSTFNSSGRKPDTSTL